MEQLLKKHGEKIRFLFVGGGLTALDFGLLFLFTSLGINKFIANYISTTISMIVSFFVNKQFTFKNKSGNAKKQFVLFIAVTITGLWVIQPIVIWLSDLLTSAYIADDAINLLIGKLIATVASLIWNYLLYSRLVFKKSPEEQ
ncbi:MAG: GtrA family protein [Candidatus Microsaccharimonas sp.]